MQNEKTSIMHMSLVCNDIYTAECKLKELETAKLPEISIVTNGIGMHKILNRAIPCKRGDIFILNSDVPHKYFAVHGEESPTISVIRFSPEEWKNRPDVDFFGVFDENSIVAYAMLNSKTLGEVLDLFEMIRKELETKNKIWEHAVRSILTMLLITVGRYVNSAMTTEINEWISVSAAITAIEENFSDPNMTLESIAESLYISQSYLSRLFKKYTEVSFKEYVQSVRFEKSMEFLTETSLSVEEIAASCGIRDLPTFYTIFKKKTGTSPHQYRKTIKDNVNKGELKMQILTEISENLQKGKSKIVKELVQKAIDSGASPEEILNKGLLDGMNVIGEKFKKNEVYVPEVLVAARAMNMGMQVLKPILIQAGVSAAGKVCIGTVQGDLHDIGKNLVKMMMEGKGLEVIDLGTDVSPETFVNTAISENCQVICCSALLTTTMDVMADVVKAAEDAGIRDKVKIMIGGAPVTDDYCKQIGADAYTSDAASAANAALELCKA